MKVCVYVFTYKLYSCIVMTAVVEENVKTVEVTYELKSIYCIMHKEGHWRMLNYTPDYE